VNIPLYREPALQQFPATFISEETEEFPMVEMLVVAVVVVVVRP
jgi:hypothetical protein